MSVTLCVYSVHKCGCMCYCSLKILNAINEFVYLFIFFRETCRQGKDCFFHFDELCASQIVPLIVVIIVIIILYRLQ